MADARALFAPAPLGPVLLRNRIVMAPMTTRHANAEGYVTKASLAYYRARAKGGVGLLTVEMAGPEKVGRHRHNELGLYDDRFLEGLRQLVAVIHHEGAKASIQLGHGGGHTRRDICGEEPIAPSAVVHSVHEGHTEEIIPQAMTVERIRQSQQSFVTAALRARKAGFDAVEIHAAHGYLLSQFMSHVENKRSDAYGGSLENRMRFSLEIVRQVKQAVPDLAVIFRMNGDDFFEGGIGLDDAVQLAQWAEQAGADAIHVTAGHYRSEPSAAIMIPPMAAGRMPFRAYAKAIKAKVTIPVITVGRYGDPADAQEVIASGDADFVALGRPLLADPDWVNKAARDKTPVPCIACNSCVDGMRDGLKLHCLVNPATGHEERFAGLTLAMTGKRIAVIGAGPAGLTFAQVMADQNEVTVFEKTQAVGGSFLWAGYAPKFQTVDARPDTFMAYLRGMKAICAQKGVILKTGIDPLSDPSCLEGYDWIVVATGARLPLGLDHVVRPLLKAGLFQQGWLKRLFSQDSIRSYFYYHLRQATGAFGQSRLKTSARISVIGDAAKAGKAHEAIRSAYDLAFH